MPGSAVRIRSGAEQTSASRKRGVGPGRRALRSRTSRRGRRLAANTGTYVLLTVWAAVCLAPLAWVVVTAFTEQSNLYRNPPSLFPNPPTLANFGYLFNNVDYVQFFVNTAIMTVLVTFGEILFGILAAYAFARIEFPGRDRLFLLLLTSLMVPPIVVMLPLYIMLNHIGWVNTLEGLVVPQIFSFGTSALVVFFLRQYFATLPRELEEAAYLDGAGLFRTLWKIVLPNAFPALGTVASLAIVAAWNNLLWPLLIINSTGKYVLTIGLASLVGEFNDANWGAIMGGTALLLLPLVLAFVAGHRYFLNSVAVTGLK